MSNAQTTIREQAEPAVEAGAAPRVGAEKVAASYDHCRSVARERARNFYYGMKLMPEPKRSAMYAVYAFMRACDDLADPEAGPAPRAKSPADIERFRQRVDRVIRDEAAATGEGPLGEVEPAFRDVMRRYPIRAALLHAMLDGQRDDLVKSRYATFEELYGYCYKVASTVGLACVSVWGYTGGEATLKLAEQRGIALQLTNILRDPVEDAQRDRVYLPADELASFGYEGDTFIDAMRHRRADERFDKLMRFQIDRARAYYAQSAELEQHIDPTCRPTCWALMSIYRHLLDKIAADPRRVLTDRVKLSAARKLAIGLGATWKRSWGG